MIIEPTNLWGQEEPVWDILRMCTTTTTTVAATLSTEAWLEWEKEDRHHASQCHQDIITIPSWVHPHPLSRGMSLTLLLRGLEWPHLSPWTLRDTL